MALEGFDSLQRAISSAPAVVKAHASSAVNASVFSVAQRARALVPVRSGQLRSQIEASRVVTGLTGGVGIVSKAGFYWRFVEFGTVNMAAQPFFRPAAEAESSVFIDRMRAIGPKMERDLSAGRFV